MCLDQLTASTAAQLWGVFFKSCFMGGHFQGFYTDYELFKVAPYFFFSTFHICLSSLSRVCCRKNSEPCSWLENIVVEAN